MSTSRLIPLVIFALTVTACAIEDPEETIEKAASVGTFSMSSTDSTDANMTWNTSNTKTSTFGEVRTLVAEGPGEARLQINLNGVKTSGDVPVTDEITESPVIMIAFSIGEAQKWVSQSASTAVVTLEPLSVDLKGVMMESPFTGGKPFSFEGNWKEKK